MSADPVTVAEQKRRVFATMDVVSVQNALNELSAVKANLTATQERCNELLEEKRGWEAGFIASEAAQVRMRDLQWRSLNDALGHPEPVNWDEATEEVKALVAGKAAAGSGEALKHKQLALALDTTSDYTWNDLLGIAADWRKRALTAEKALEAKKAPNEAARDSTGDYILPADPVDLPNDKRGRRIVLRHCASCGRVYAETVDAGVSKCTCGSELYPVAHILRIGEELRAGDDTELRANVKGPETEGATDLDLVCKGANEALARIESHWAKRDGEAVPETAETDRKYVDDQLAAGKISSHDARCMYDGIRRKEQVEGFPYAPVPDQDSMVGECVSGPRTADEPKEAPRQGWIDGEMACIVRSQLVAEPTNPDSYFVTVGEVAGSKAYLNNLLNAAGVKSTNEIPGDQASVDKALDHVERMQEARKRFKPIRCHKCGDSMRRSLRAPDEMCFQCTSCSAIRWIPKSKLRVRASAQKV